MASNTVWILGLGLGVLALVMLSRRAEAAPPETYTLNIHDIATAENLEKLDTYLELANELHVTGELDDLQYNLFYNAYVNRYNELLGEE